MRLLAPDKVLCDAWTPGDDLHNAVGKPFEHLHELQGSDARLLVRLDDD